MSVVIVGGGPAGLATAVELRRLGAGRVVVLERDETPGGVPRHCDHTGFGLRDLRRLLGGPRYAARYTDLAERAGVEIRTRATATGWAGPTSLVVTSPRGVETLGADAIVLATGCRERPRSARLVPGTRPAGVLTTGALQQLVHLHHERVGTRAVVVGAEHVSFSAVLTLADAGCATVAMVTEHPAHQTYAPLAWLAARHVDIVTNARVSAVHGRRRVEGVEVTDLASGLRRVLPCDTVVFTGDWIPDHELARGAGLTMEPGARAPRADQLGHTSARGVFAAGNLVHPAETADVAAIGGRVAASAVARFLERREWPAAVPVLCAAPLLWASPSAIACGAPAAPRVRTRIGAALAAAVVVRQGDRVLWRGRARRFVPNRSIAIPGTWIARVAPDAGAVQLAVER